MRDTKDYDTSPWLKELTEKPYLMKIVLNWVQACMVKAKLIEDVELCLSIESWI